MNTRSPKHEIENKNAWYVDDQFAVQMGNPASRNVIENRWNTFQRYIGDWRLESAINRNGRLRVLDAGCGDGINLFGLNQILDRMDLEYDLFGCDYNDLRISRAASQERVVAVNVCSLTELPYDEASFDVILCNHVLEHIPQDLEAMSELCRVLDPRGMLIAGVPNEGCIIAQLRNRVFQSEIARTTDHVNFYTRKTFTNRLSESGFKVTEVFSQGFFTPRLNWNSKLQGSEQGRKIMRRLHHWMPSQAAELIVSARRRDTGHTR